MKPCEIRHGAPYWQTVRCFFASLRQEVRSFDESGQEMARKACHYCRNYLSIFVKSDSIIICG